MASVWSILYSFDLIQFVSLLLFIYRQRKSRKAKRSEDEGSREEGIVELKPQQFQDDNQLYRSEKRLVKHFPLNCTF